MKQDLDKEWIQLMFSAKQQGLTKEEIRAFIRQNQTSKTNQAIG